MIKYKRTMVNFIQYVSDIVGIKNKKIKTVLLACCHISSITYLFVSLTSRAC